MISHPSSAAIKPAKGYTSACMGVISRQQSSVFKCSVNCGHLRRVYTKQIVNNGLLLRFFLPNQK